MRKSTRRVLKTVRAQQLELEDEDPALAPAVTTANNANSEDISVDDDEEAAFMRREEEEESDEDEDDEEKLSSNNDSDDSDEPESVQVVPQKRKNGKDIKKPTSKPFCVIFKVF
jgi:hypothetical protein